MSFNSVQHMMISRLVPGSTSTAKRCFIFPSQVLQIVSVLCSYRWSSSWNRCFGIKLMHWLRNWSCYGFAQISRCFWILSIPETASIALAINSSRCDTIRFIPSWVRDHSLVAKVLKSCFQSCFLAVKCLYVHCLTLFLLQSDLIIFAAASPTAAIAIYAVNGLLPNLLGSTDIGYLLLFSGGTFLFVACTHIIPSFLTSSESMSRQQVIAVAAACTVPPIVSSCMGHGH